VIEDYYHNALDANYIRMASSYLEGSPRSLWTNLHKAYKACHAVAKPPVPWMFFRETMEHKARAEALEYLEQSLAGSFSGPRQVKR
jgi:hypothetical protein